MALSAQEEALVRQLLDQQAAILSLAGNEATITSKLGATKVTLADLVAASPLADADLLLTRQGTNDKSVTAKKLAEYIASQVGIPTAVAGGTANAITANFTPNVTLTNGTTVIVRAGAANTTTTPTFAPDGLPAKPIVKGNNLPLAAGDIAGAGHWLVMNFDTVLDKWVLQNPVVTQASDTRAGIVSLATAAETQAGTDNTRAVTPAGLAAAGATKLRTPRTINGTSFDGTANITTANWGAARTLTIGNTGKSVNGAGNVSWSLGEIGAPAKDGTGATGTWGISVSGNAATATRLQTARTINGASFDGSANIETTEWVHSDRNFVNGTLISTSIDYSGLSGAPWVLEIRGNSYSAAVPFDIQYQGYIYDGTIVHHGGYSNGTNISGMVALNVGGQLCFWFPRQDYWQGFNVRVYSARAGRAANLVLSITDEAKPAGTKEVALSVNIRQSLNSGDFKGANQSLVGNGYQKLPGGLIIQWVTGTAFPANTAEETQAITFPITFPTAVLSCVVSMDIASSSTQVDCWFQLFGTTVSGTKVQKQTSPSPAINVTQTPRIIAIGY